jgi:hypothetical protein
MLLNKTREEMLLQAEAARTDAWKLEQDELVRLFQLRNYVEGALGSYAKLAMDDEGSAARDDEGRLLVTASDIAALARVSLAISKQIRTIRQGKPFEAASRAAEAKAVEQVSNYLGAI